MARSPRRTWPGASPARMALISSGTFRRTVPNHVSRPEGSTSTSNRSPSGSFTMTKAISICPYGELATSRK